MSCKKRFLMFRWEKHDWVRQVSATVGQTFEESDMWGRKIASEHVICHARYVCRDCGAIRDGEECGCDKAKADQCAVRLAYLNEPKEPMPRRA